MVKFVREIWAKEYNKFFIRTLWVLDNCKSCDGRLNFIIGLLWSQYIFYGSSKWIIKIKDSGIQQQKDSIQKDEEWSSSKLINLCSLWVAEISQQLFELNCFSWGYYQPVL